MLLRRVKSPLTLMGCGQLLLAIAILGGRYVKPAAPFWAGFADALFMSFLVLSSVLSLRGLILHRRTSS